ncbi:hypothetical protein IQ249_11235 [Lusitaniella coriacea LEGE 07157]|uniref:Uncharacterized protein n=1 Tax=Lusitaniella coriacea LEGE 07157 TaxID=945747 RepID=A0A8J7IUE8_9CYAN|nr:hypothetical protein [Lusitaniella coriacea]MBE9116473.1 hypothetical protein [Lusitaniella coriacea LEGE 07157]
MKRKFKVLKSVYHNPTLRRSLLICAGITAFIIIAQPYLVGSIYSSAKAVDLLKGLQSSSLYFGSAITTASATVLALMLTLLSMTNKSENEFDGSVYRSIEIVGLISTATFIGAVLLLLCLSLPVGKFDNIPPGWYRGLYYTLSTLNGLLSGLMTAGILILFDTVRLLIRDISPHRDYRDY